MKIKYKKDEKKLMKRFYNHFGNGETPQIKRYKKYKKWLYTVYPDYDLVPKKVHKKNHKLLDKAIKSVVLSDSEFKMIQLFRKDNELFIEINTQLKQEYLFTKAREAKCKILHFQPSKNTQKTGDKTNSAQKNAFTNS